MRPALVAASILLLVATPAFAAHVHLKADGSGDYATIKAAVAALASGDTILCADGTYTGAGTSGIDFAGKNLVLRSENNRPKDCILEPGSGRAFYFHSGETASAIVQGFTIRGGGESQGGGVYVTNASPTFFNCVIRDCQAGDGGAVYLEGASANPSFLNCALVHNQATNRGGAIFLHYAHGVVRNCTLAYNEAMDAEGGGGIYDSYSTPTVSHCVIWGNWNQQVHGVLTGYSWNLIEGWVSGGTSNFAGNPSFVTGTGGAFYLLAGTSDAEDAGGALASATCFTTADGSQCLDRWTTRTDQRDDSGTLDVGYHYPHHSAGIHVPSYKPTIQAAIDAAWNDDVVLVADGSYTGDGNRDLVTRGKRVTVRSQSGNAASCVIDCAGSSGAPHRGFYIHEGEGPQTVIEDLKIVNGWVAGNGGGINVSLTSPTIRDCILDGNHAGDSGGGLMCYMGNPVVTGCTFTNNSSGNAGGGMLCHTCAPVLSNCLFQSNSAVWGGAGLHNYLAGPTLDQCTFRLNSCTSGGGGGIHNDGAAATPRLTNCLFDENYGTNGGGMYNRNAAHPTLTDCVFTTNWTAAAGRGGGIYGTGSLLTATRCTFAGNDAGVDGGGLYSRAYGGATLDSCLFLNNTAPSGGGGIYFYDHDNSTVTNCTFYQNDSPSGGGLWTWSACVTNVARCIFWDNRATTAGVSIGLNGSCAMTVSCSDVAGGQAGVYVGGGSALTWGAGNFDADPLFCSTGPAGMNVDASSPCAPAHSGGCGLVGARPVACTTDAGPGVRVADRLHASFPNPFATRARIAFEIAARTHVSLEVYDVSGRLVRVLARQVYEPGLHETTWDGRDGGGRAVARGAYFCRLKTATSRDVVRMEVIR